MRGIVQPKILLYILWLGDVLTLAIVTAYGFATHGELAQAGTRMLTTFLPLLIAWLVVAGPGNLLQLTYVFQARHLWRPVWAMILAAPLAGLIRSWMLGNRPVIPVFILVLMGVSTAAILAWRAIFLFLFARKTQKVTYG